MIFTIQAFEYNRHADILEAMFRLRKRVFGDQLGWNVRAIGAEERDDFDLLGPAYLVWTDSGKQRLIGSLRLMPTTGPTLLASTFSGTFPPNCDLKAPGIWEVTRLCLDDAVLREACPGLHPGDGFSIMLLGLVECALAHGIQSVIANYEPHMMRIYRRAGLVVEELGRADGFGRYPICCGIAAASEEVRDRMRHAIGIHRPVFATPGVNADLAKSKAIRAA
jgi:acyl homoserine lactone synthase